MPEPLAQRGAAGDGIGDLAADGRSELSVDEAIEDGVPQAQSGTGPAGVLRLPLPGASDNPGAVLEFLKESLETLSPTATYN